MDLRALRYFVETVHRQSFTQAAQALHVTQSTVSKMVRQLEDELGQTLLWRGPGRVQPTDAGRVVYEHGCQALQLMQGLHRELDDLGAWRRGSLTVGIPPMVNVFFSSLIQRFRARHPGIQLQVREAGGDLIGHMVAQGELEVGVSVLPLAPAPAEGPAHAASASRWVSAPESGTGVALETALVGRYAVCLVATRDAAWTRLKRPGLAALHEQAVVMPAPGYALHRLLHQRWQALGVVPHIAAVSGQWDFLLSMAQAGMGTAILPQPLIERLHLGEDVIVRALPAQELSWEVAHIWARGRYLSHAARAWLDCCRGPSA